MRLSFIPLLAMLSLLPSCSVKESDSLLKANVSKSLIGLHTGLCSNFFPGQIQPGEPGPCNEELAWQFLSKGKPRLFKLLDPDAIAKAGRVKSLSPQTTIIGRLHLPSQQQSGTPKAAAEAWWTRVQATVLAAKAVDYWEGYNEPSVASIEEMDWIARFEVERIALLRKHGRRACIGNFSVGNPDIDTITSPQRTGHWEAFLPALQAASKNGGILCLHQYANTADFLDGNFNYLVGRHRQVRTFLESRGLSSLKIAITEFGFDKGGNPLKDGWRAQAAFKDPARYVEQLKRYDQYIQGDAHYLIGLALYQHGSVNWPSFNVQEILPDLTAYLSK